MNNFWLGTSTTLITLNAVFLFLYLATGWKLEMVQTLKPAQQSCIASAHEPTKGKGK